MRFQVSITGWTLIVSLAFSGVACAASPLLVNGELDQWASGGLVGWEALEGVVAEKDTTMRVSGTASLRMYPTRDQQAAHTHSIIEQKVELKPNSTYRLTFWTAKDDTGDVRTGSWQTD